MDSKEALKSNFQIMYEELQSLINKYVRNTGDRLLERKVEAYLSATIHALVDYSSRFLKLNSALTACNYVNNTIKHADGFVSYKQIEGGVEFSKDFSIDFPIDIKPIEVVWRNVDLDCWHDNQKRAYKELFEGKNILDTLAPIVKEILDGEDI